jgi:hypothetical protein
LVERDPEFGKSLFGAVHSLEKGDDGDNNIIGNDQGNVDNHTNLKGGLYHDAQGKYGICSSMSIRQRSERNENFALIKGVDVPALAYCGFGIKCNPQKSGFWKYQIQTSCLNKYCSSEWSQDHSHYVHHDIGYWCSKWPKN